MNGEQRTPGPKKNPPAPLTLPQRLKGFLIEGGKVAGAILAICALLIPILGYGISCVIEDNLAAVQTNLETTIGAMEQSLEGRIEEATSTLGQADQKIESEVGLVGREVSYLRGVMDTIRDLLDRNEREGAAAADSVDSATASGDDRP